MRKCSKLIIILVLLLTAVTLPVAAQEPDFTEVQVNSTETITPTIETAELFSEVPELTEEQMAQVQWGIENSHRPANLAGAEEQAIAVGPTPGTESMEPDTRDVPGAPLAPGTAMTYRWRNNLPAPNSNITEASLEGKGRYHFYTGNWFAASSVDKGFSWNYVSPWTGMSDFCCDQVVRHDLTRNIFIWLRMASADSAGQNNFKLSISFNTPFTGGFWTYTFVPTWLNAGWTHQWWDYPAMSLTADHLYLTWHIFDWNGTGWTTNDDFYVRTVVLKYSLDTMAAGGSLGASWFETNWFAVKPVDGADHTMYMASNWPATTPQNNRLGIWRWKDADNSISFWDRTVANAWDVTGRGSMHCGTPNWLNRADQRVLAGARYNIDTSDLQNPGRNVVAWWWNVREGQFATPYIDAAAFYEDTMTQVAGTDGRPYVYSSSYCFAFPDVATNANEDLGMIFNFSQSPTWHMPYSAYALGDDYATSPPGWTFYGVAASNAGPSDQVWGDYNTVRSFMGLTTWIAGVHYIPGGGNCSNCSTPVYFSFGRERDQNNYWWW
jgi:hypothetical protein